MKRERKIEEIFCNFDCFKTKMWSSFAELMGFSSEEEQNEERKTLIEGQCCTEQPSGWNKMGREIKVKYPIVTTGDWQHSFASRIRHLEALLKTRITKMNKNSESMNKASMVHSEMKKTGIIGRQVVKYGEWGSLSFGFSKPIPVFVYVGTFEDESTYAVVLDADGNNQATYYGVSTACNHVEILWKKVLAGFDWKGAIQMVVLLDNFYDIAKKNECPVLPEGSQLKAVWDTEINNMYSSEICYEVLGFGDSIFDETTGRRYSNPGFCCVGTFNEKMRPHVFHTFKEGLVWYITNTKLMLVRPRTGEIWETHDLTAKETEFIAEKIIEPSV